MNVCYLLFENFFCCDLVWPNLTNVEKSKSWLERQTSLEIRVSGCDRRPCYFFEQASSYYFCGEIAWFKDWGLVANAKSRLCSNVQPIMWYREICVFKPWFLFLLCVIQLLEMLLVWLWELLDAIPKPATTFEAQNATPDGQDCNILSLVCKFDLEKVYDHAEGDFCICVWHIFCMN